METISIMPWEVAVMLYPLDIGPPHVHFILREKQYVLDVEDDDPLMELVRKSKVMKDVDDDSESEDLYSDVEQISENMIRVKFLDDSVKEYKIKSATDLAPIETIIDVETGEQILDPMGPVAKRVEALPDMMLRVTFENDEIRLYDVKPLLYEEVLLKDGTPLKAFKALEDEDLFRRAHLSPGGYGIIWDGNTDLAIEEIWKNGKTP